MTVSTVKEAKEVDRKAAAMVLEITEEGEDAAEVVLEIAEVKVTPVVVLVSRCGGSQPSSKSHAVVVVLNNIYTCI